MSNYVKFTVNKGDKAFIGLVGQLVGSEQIIVEYMSNDGLSCNQECWTPLIMDGVEKKLTDKNTLLVLDLPLTYRLVPEVDDPDLTYPVLFKNE